MVTAAVVCGQNTTHSPDTTPERRTASVTSGVTSTNSVQLRVRMVKMRMAETG